MRLGPSPLGSPAVSMVEDTRDLVHRVEPRRDKNLRKKTRLHRCSVCGKDFNRSEHLKRHERIHTRAKPFECSHCKRTFVRDDVLSRHLRAFHPLSPPASNDAAVETRKSPSVIEPIFPSNAAPLESCAPPEVIQEPGQSAGYADLEPEGIHQPSRNSSQGHTRQSPPEIAQIPGSTASNNRPGVAVQASTFEEDDASLMQIIQNCSNVRTELDHPLILDDVHRHNNPFTITDVDTYATLFPDWSSPYYRNFTLADGFDSFLASTPMMDPPCVGGPPSSIPGLPTVHGDMNGADTRRIADARFHCSPLSKPPSMTVTTSSANILPSLVMFGDQRSAETRLMDLEDRYHMNAYKKVDIQDPTLPKTYPEKIYALYPGLQSKEDSLPTKHAFIRYQKLFFDHFIPHTPIIHRLSFEMEGRAAPLVLSIMSIGALYAAEHRTSWAMHCMSKDLLTHHENATLYARGAEGLWTLQTSFLNLLYAAWSGDSRGLKFARAALSSLTEKLMRAAACSEIEFESDAMFFDSLGKQLVEIEESKRLFYAVYVFSNTFSCALGENPILFNHDCKNLKMPCGDDEFGLALTTAENRAKLWSSSRTQPSFEHILSTLSPDQHTLSAFSLRILITAVRLEIWQMKQIICTGSNLVNAAWQQLISARLEIWYACFLRCKMFHESAHYRAQETQSRLFDDVLPMYHCAQLELFHSFHDLVPEMKEYESSPDVAAGKLSERRSGLPLSSETTQCMRHCFDCVSPLISLGIHFAARTAPLECSADYAPLSSLHCVSLCIWLSRMEDTNMASSSSPEGILITDVVNLLRDAGYRPEKENLASTLAGAWASIWEQNWVWRVSAIHSRTFRAYRQQVHRESVSST